MVRRGGIMSEKNAQSKHEAQLRYVQVIVAEVWKVDSRVEGYRRALKDTVTEILALELSNVQRKTNITQKVQAKVDSLGTYLTSQGWSNNDEETL